MNTEYEYRKILNPTCINVQGLERNRPRNCFGALSQAGNETTYTSVEVEVDVAVEVEVEVDVVSQAGVATFNT